MSKTESKLSKRFKQTLTRDLCVNQAGQVEIIEGNHAPDFDGGMQAPLKIGVKKKLQKTVIDVLGVDPLPYISVWKSNHILS